MTIQETINNSKKNRSNMIDSFTPPVIAGKAASLVTLTDLRDTVESYLFNNVAGSYGINTIIDSYWNSIINLRTSGSFSLALTSAITRTWTFASCPVYAADGTLKSPISRYISDNNLSLGATSIFDGLVTQIGIIASDISAYISGYVYTTQALALAAQVTFVATLARTGSGILGTRTIDISNQSTSQDPITPFRWRFLVGNAVSDTPDAWGASGAAILTSLNAIIVSLTSILTYLDKINNFYTTLATNNCVINKTLFTGFDAGFSTYYSNVQTQISTLTTYYNTINTLKNDLPTNRAAINLQLTNLRVDLGTYKTTNENRITTVSSGNTIMGLVTTSTTVNYYREEILAMLVSFPDGIYNLMTTPASQAVTIAAEIAKTEKQLLSFGLTSDEFITTPVMISARWNNRLKTQVNLSWTSPIFPSSYKIYRKESSLVTDNSQWVVGDIIDTIDYTDPDTITGWTKTSYSDTSIPDNTKNYVYRVQSSDTYWSGHSVPCVNSSSLQSDVWLLGVVNSKALSS
jgi:hypothetical protein